MGNPNSVWGELYIGENGEPAIKTCTGQLPDGLKGIPEKRIKTRAELKQDEIEAYRHEDY